MGSFIGIQKIAAQRIGISYDSYLEKIEKGLKWCIGCKTWKGVNEFSIDNSRGDGRNARCYTCRRVKIKKTTKGRPSPLRGIKMSDAAKRKMSIAHTGEKNHRWKGGVKKYTASRQQILARRKVNHEVQAGRLPSPKTLQCYDCENNAREYDHYRGYEEVNWLIVEPVCSKCHRLREKNRK